MERDMKDQLTDDINEIRVEFLQNWEKFMRRQNEMQADFDFLNNAMNEGMHVDTFLTIPNIDKSWKQNPKTK